MGREGDSNGKVTIMTFSDPEEHIVTKIFKVLTDEQGIDYIHVEDGSVLVFEDMQILPGQRKVIYNGKDVELTTREFDILYTLACYHDQVLTVEQIYKAVTGEEALGDYHSIENSVYSIRKKLKHDVIQNVRGYGYKFSQKESGPEIE